MLQTRTFAVLHRHLSARSARPAKHDDASKALSLLTHSEHFCVSSGWLGMQCPYNNIIGQCWYKQASSTQTL
eukprot:5182482-Amphidinium_carterae.1